MGNTNSFSIWVFNLRHLKCLHHLLLLICWVTVVPRGPTVPASQQSQSPSLAELQSKETTETPGVGGSKCSDPKHVQEEINQSPKQASIPIQKHTSKMPTLNPSWRPAALANSTSSCSPGLRAMAWQGHLRLAWFFQQRSMNSLYSVLVSEVGSTRAARLQKIFGKAASVLGGEEGKACGTRQQNNPRRCFPTPNATNCQ